MVVILAKSVSFNLLVLILRKRYYCIEYLEPINNSIIKILVKLMESNFNFRFRRVKMGKIKNFENENLQKISFYQATNNQKRLRLSIYKNSNFPVFDLLNDQILKKNFLDEVARNLIINYKNIRRSELKKKDNVIIFEEKKIFYFECIRKLNNFLIIEIFKILVFCSKQILKGFVKKNEKKSKTLSLDGLFLASEPYAKTSLDYSLRNQQVLSKNILGNDKFGVIDLINMRFYGNKFNHKIKKASFIKFLSIFNSFIPAFTNYNKIKYSLNIKDFIKSLLLIFKIWSVSKDIHTTKFCIDSNSYEGSCMLILGKIQSIPCYIFQGSLLGQMNPYLHNPYANVIGFTNKHIEIYINESKGFNFVKTNSIKIDYPYLSNFNFKRIDRLKQKLSSNFDLSIAFFDENYGNENRKDHAVCSIFYKDFKRELEILLTIANLNPRIALVFKSQFISNSIVNLINKDNDLKKLFNSNQIFDINIKTKYNDRNIITPAEIAQSVDLSISNTMGGTAGYEASTVDCRTIFIKSGLSLYDQLLPKNVTINNLTELNTILKKINYSRELLYKSNIGKLEKVL